MQIAIPSLSQYGPHLFPIEWPPFTYRWRISNFHCCQQSCPHSLLIKESYICSKWILCFWGGGENLPQLTQLPSIDSVIGGHSWGLSYFSISSRSLSFCSCAWVEGMTHGGRGLLGLGRGCRPHASADPAGLPWTTVTSACPWPGVFLLNTPRPWKDYTGKNSL